MLIREGPAPILTARLIEMGSYNPAFTNGWWALYFSPDGTQLSFGTSTNGGGMTNLSANISWVSNEWYQIALTYSPTGSTLYVDGQLLTNGAGVIYFPNADELTNGFRIGSDQDGGNQAEGAFDELETFDNPLNATNAATYSNGVPDWWEIEYFGRTGVGYDPDGDGQSIWYDYQNGINPNTISFSILGPEPICQHQHSQRCHHDFRRCAFKHYCAGGQYQFCGSGLDSLHFIKHHCKSWLD